MRGIQRLMQVAVLCTLTIASGCGGRGGPACGNGKLEAGELCDDGNTNSGDGCSSTCQLERGWKCTTPAGSRTTCTPICGDGLLVGAEVCDDGNTAAGDGCSPNCLVESGWECHGEPSVCTLLPARVRTPPSLGAPITGLAAGQWSYVEFPNSICGDGSPTGLFISPGSQDLLFVMDGGSACSDYAGCSSLLSQVLPAPVVRNPLGSVDAAHRQSLLSAMNSSSFWAPASPFSRGDPNNVFRDFTFLYVMHCTGDFYGGDAVVTYAGLTINHKGHANIVAFLARVAATWPAPTRLVVAGASAGGFGSLINYDTFRLYWPNQKMYLIDDSGPALAGVAFPNGWLPSSDPWTLWNVQAALADVCPNCHTDFSAIYPALARWYSNDRKSLLSHLADPAIEAAYGASDTTFTAALRATASTALEPSRWEWFYALENGHVLIGNTTLLSAGIPLSAFLQAQIDDDPSWSPVAPPLMTGLAP